MGVQEEGWFLTDRLGKEITFVSWSYTRVEAQDGIPKETFIPVLRSPLDVSELPGLS
jgi:hypothetical protein